MVENLLAIVAVAGAAFVVTLLAGVLFSERVRHRGLGKAIWVEVSSEARMRDPYRG
jgi:hypothetical protein